MLRMVVIVSGMWKIGSTIYPQIHNAVRVKGILAEPFRAERRASRRSRLALLQILLFPRRKLYRQSTGRRCAFRAGRQGTIPSERQGVRLAGGARSLERDPAGVKRGSTRSCFKQTRLERRTDSTRSICAPMRNPNKGWGDRCAASCKNLQLEPGQCIIAT